MMQTLQNVVSSVSSSTNSWLNHHSAWQTSAGAGVTAKRKESRTGPTAGLACGVLNLLGTSTSAKSVTSSAVYDLSQLPQYTLAQVSEHWKPDDCWIVVYDRVYDVTDFLDEHPGGQYIIMEHAGRDATLVFRGSRHSDDAHDMLDKYLVGVLVESERLYLTTGSSL